MIYVLLEYMLIARKVKLAIYSNFVMAGKAWPSSYHAPTRTTDTWLSRPI